MTNRIGIFKVPLVPTFSLVCTTFLIVPNVSIFDGIVKIKMDVVNEIRCHGRELRIENLRVGVIGRDNIFDGKLHVMEKITSRSSSFKDVFGSDDGGPSRRTAVKIISMEDGRASYISIGDEIDPKVVRRLNQIPN